MNHSLHVTWVSGVLQMNVAEIVTLNGFLPRHVCVCGLMSLHAIQRSGICNVIQIREQSQGKQTCLMWLGLTYPRLYLTPGDYNPHSLPRVDPEHPLQPRHEAGGDDLRVLHVLNPCHPLHQVTETLTGRARHAAAD